MNDSSTPKDGDFAHWIEEKSEALKFELGEKFPVPPTTLHSPSAHVETGQCCWSMSSRAQSFLKNWPRWKTHRR
jgi:hypothetical protein